MHLRLLVISRSLCSPMLKYAAASVKVRFDFSRIGTFLFLCFSANTSFSFADLCSKTKYTWYNLNCLWHRHHRNFTSATTCRLSQGVSLSIILLIAHSCHGMLLSNLKSLHTLLSIFTKTGEKIYLCRCLMAHRQSASRIIPVFRLLPYERILIRYLSRFTGKFLFLKTSSHKVLTEKYVFCWFFLACQEIFVLILRIKFLNHISQ